MAGRPWDVPRRYRRGLSSIYVAVFIVAIVGFASLAVDIGRIRLARTELQVATDAAARAGADSLPITIAATINNTVDAADHNTVIDAERDKPTPDGERTNPGVDLVPDEDIAIGTWAKDAQTGEFGFTEIEDVGKTVNDPRRRGNAVRVWGRRIKDRNNPIPLIFARVLPDGPLSTDLEREAIAKISGGPGNFAFVGIDHVDSNGNGATIDSMVYGKLGKGGGVGSDGDVDLGNGDVYGDARPGINGQLKQKNNSEVTGWTAPLDYKLATRPEYQPVTTPAGTAVFTPPGNGNWTIPPAGTTPSYNKLAPRVYVIHGDMTLNGNKEIQILGYVVLYVEGNVKIDGNHVVNDANPQDPARFTLNVVGTATKPNPTVDIGGNATQYMHLFAPLSPVKVHGGANMNYYGWIVGKTLSFIGSSNLHYDESRDDGRHFTISLVK